MSETNIHFLKEQILNSIGNAHSIDLSDATFQIRFDEEEKQEPKTNLDEIMVYSALPKLLNKNLTIDDVCRALVTGRNEIPLWIKLKLINSSAFRLTISKRFRKKSVVEKWHKENQYYPIITE